MLRPVIDSLWALALFAALSSPFALGSPEPAWARGIEGQRKADLGDGTYLNPILAGDRPDPSVLKDGDDYYLVVSSFETYPGLPLWHSRDLVNWEPIGTALRKNVGSVWAPDLCKYQGRYYIYFPGKGEGGRGTNYVVWSDDIRGPWSDPIDLKVGWIDPGHIVDGDGKRFLMLSGGNLAPLARDGLSVVGPLRKVYDGWVYPEEWETEGFALEGPKMLRRGDYFYMLSAEGGTAGPPTSHMVVCARAKALEGPWENSPYNPVVRTRERSELWWSRGHATLVEGPDRNWYLVYHAYENGYRTLGRQTLLEPVEWTEDGWLRSKGSDLAAPIPIPAGGSAVPHGLALSDDFSSNKRGIQWGFFGGGADDANRFRYEKNELVLKAKGSSPKDCSPLSFVCGDRAYEVQVEIEIDPRAAAGLLVFYSDRLYAGLGFSGRNIVMHRNGLERFGQKPGEIRSRFHLRLRNDRNIVTLFYSADGERWTRYPVAMEVSGYNHNVAHGFLSLRPALYAAGQGEVRFKNFKYHALP